MSGETTILNNSNTNPTTYGSILDSIEKGNGTLQQTTTEVAQKILVQPPGTIELNNSAAIEAAKSNWVDPVTPPNTAAGDFKKFLFRQEFLLIKKYIDSMGRLVSTIGRVIYNILDKAEPTAFSTIDSTTAKNLNLISTNKDDKTIADVFEPKTKMGKAFIDLTITRPTADRDCIGKRQGAVRSLVEDAPLRSSVDKQLAILGENETAMIARWDGDTSLPAAANSMYYTTFRETLNNSSIALSLSAAGVTWKKFATLGTTAISSVILPLYAGAEFFRGVLGATTPGVLSGYATHMISSTALGALGGFTVWLFNNPYVNAVLAGAACVYSVSSLPASYGWAKEDTRMLYLMRDVLSKVAAYYRAMKELHEILQNSSSLKNNLKYFNELDAFISNRNDTPELKTLFSLLESSTFDLGTPSFFDAGKVLLVWELFHSGDDGKVVSENGAESKKPKKPKKEGKTENTNVPGNKIRSAFEKALPAIGEIDLVSSAAHLVVGSKDSLCKYSIPTFDFTATSSPKLHLKGVWHPLLGNSAVPNDLFLGEGDPSRNAVITGPNAGGKSTLGRAALLASIMGASAGIAPVEEGSVLSPFSLVRSSMNITDAVGEDSQFTAQARRVADIEGRVTELAEKHIPTLTLFDEVFTQTNEKDGKKLAKNVTENLGKMPHNINLTVTHFGNVAAAVDSSKKPAAAVLSYKNYRMEKDSTYLLREGISSDTNARALAKDLGVEGSGNSSEEE